MNKKGTAMSEKGDRNGCQSGFLTGTQTALLSALRCIAFCFVFGVHGSVFSTFAADDLNGLSKTFRQCAERVAPSVVHIQVSHKRSVSPGRSGRAVMMQVEESGSGVLANIAGKTVILTNRHVVSGNDADSIQILTQDRHILKVLNITENEDFDIAVVDVSGKLPPPVKFGNSDELAAGDIILALGSPFGLERSLSMGVISAVGRRSIPGNGAATPRIRFFQVDAAVNPGSSGGPMLNLNGEVVGLSTAIATQGGGNEGVAFVMPIKTVLRVAEQLVKTGSVVRPYIGCGFDASFSMDDRRRLGIERLIGSRLKTVESGGPASQAGLKTGDVIVSFNGTEVEEDSHIVLLVAESEIGKPVPLKVNRNGQALDITLTPATQLSR